MLDAGRAKVSSKKVFSPYYSSLRASITHLIRPYPAKSLPGDPPPELPPQHLRLYSALHLKRGHQNVNVGVHELRELGDRYYVKGSLVVCG